MRKFNVFIVLVVCIIIMSPCSVAQGFGGEREERPGTGEGFGGESEEYYYLIENRDSNAVYVGTQQEILNRLSQTKDIAKDDVGSFDALRDAGDVSSLTEQQFETAQTHWQESKGQSLYYKDKKLVIHRADGLRTQIGETGNAVAYSDSNQLPGNALEWEKDDGQLKYDDASATVEDDGSIRLTKSGATLSFSPKDAEVKTLASGQTTVTFPSGARVKMSQTEYESISIDTIDDYEEIFKDENTGEFLGFSDKKPVFRAGSKYYVGTNPTSREELPPITTKYETVKGTDIKVSYDPNTREAIGYAIGDQPIDSSVYQQMKEFRGSINVKEETIEQQKFTSIQFLDPNTNLLLRKTSFSEDYSVETDEEGEITVTGIKTIEEYRTVQTADETYPYIQTIVEEGTVSSRRENEFFYDEDGNLQVEGYVYNYDEESGRLQYDRFYFADSQTGEEYFYDSKTESWIDAEGDTVPESQLPERAARARTIANVRRHINNFERAADVFSGLGFYTRLFMSDADMRAWRDAVDDLFCSTILFGDIECWTSEICSHTYDKSTDSTAYVELPSGMIETAAHIEAERSMPIPIPEGNITEYLYKITFYVKAHEENLRFNVILYGDQETRLFSEDITLEGEEIDEEEEDQLVSPEGNDYSALGEDAVVQYSSKLYDKVCIEFSDGDVDDLCNRIAESDYSKDNYIASQASASGAGSESAGGEATINQI